MCIPLGTHYTPRIGCSSPHSVCAAHEEDATFRAEPIAVPGAATKSHVETLAVHSYDAIARADPVVVPAEATRTRVEAVTSLTAAVNARM